jgi:hypothetical protein
MSDFKQSSNEARERLVAELHKTVATFGAAVDEAVGAMLDAAEAEARRAEQLAGPGLEPLRKLSTELLEKAIELDRNVNRLSELAAEAASQLRRSLVAETPASSKPLQAGSPPPATDPRPELSKPPAFERRTPLDVIEDVRNSIAESPIDLAPRPRRFGSPAGPAEQESKAKSPPVPAGVRLVIEQMRLAGEPDSAIVEHLEGAGIEDPARVLDELNTTS